MIAQPNPLWSTQTIPIMIKTNTRTTPVYLSSSCRVGVTTFRSPRTTWRRKSTIRANGFRRSDFSRRAVSTRSSLGSSCSLRATWYTFRHMRERCSQGGQDSNLQPAVLETAALPIEPPPYRSRASRKAGPKGRVLPRPAEPTKMGTTKLGQKSTPLTGFEDGTGTKHTDGMSLWWMPRDGQPPHPPSQTSRASPAQPREWARLGGVHKGPSTPNHPNRGNRPGDRRTRRAQPHDCPPESLRSPNPQPSGLTQRPKPCRAKAARSFPTLLANPISPLRLTLLTRPARR